VESLEHEGMRRPESRIARNGGTSSPGAIVLETSKKKVKWNYIYPDEKHVDMLVLLAEARSFVFKILCQTRQKKENARNIKRKYVW